MIIYFIIVSSTCLSAKNQKRGCVKIGAASFFSISIGQLEFRFCLSYDSIIGSTTVEAALFGLNANVVHRHVAVVLVVAGSPCGDSDNRA